MATRKDYPGNVRYHNGRWRIQLSVGGKRHCLWLEHGTEEEAKQFARDEYGRLQQRNGRGLPGPMPFSDLLQRYRDDALPDLAPNSVKAYETSLQAFETYFVTQSGDPSAHAITRGHVNAFMSWRKRHAPNGDERETPVSPRTIAKDRVVLHVLFAFGEGLDIVDSNPVAKTVPPTGDQREPVILKPAEYEKLVGACEGRPMLELYVLVLGETGARCDSEALWLRWEDVDLERGLLNIESVRKGRRTKSGKSRRVPMTARLREAMRAHMARYRFAAYHGQRTEWVFHHELDRRHAKAGTRLGGLRRAFAGAVERAELPADLNQHDLRHRRVTTWLAEGKPAHIVQKAMGHSDLRTTLHYEHMVDDDLLQLVEPVQKAPQTALGS